MSEERFDSNYAIGDPVVIKFSGGKNDGVEIHGYVRAATFTASKVRYSVKVLCGSPDGSLSPEQLEAHLAGEEPELENDCAFTLHNVDSCLVFPGEGEPIELGADNYS